MFIFIYLLVWGSPPCRTQELLLAHAQKNDELVTVSANSESENSANRDTSMPQDLSQVDKPSPGHSQMVNVWNYYGFINRNDTSTLLSLSHLSSLSSSLSPPQTLHFSLLSLCLSLPLHSLTPPLSLSPSSFLSLLTRRDNLLYLQKQKKKK